MSDLGQGYLCYRTAAQGRTLPPRRPAPEPLQWSLLEAGQPQRGDQLSYAIGRRLEVRRLWILRSPGGQRTVARAEGALAKRGPSFILAARFIPIGRVAVNLTAGATRYPRRRFVALTAVAAVTWSLYSVAIGLTAGAWFRDRPLVAVAIGVVGGLLGGLVLDRCLARRQARRLMRHQRTVAEGPAGAGGAPVEAHLAC